MSSTRTDFKLVTEDYWERFLRRTVETQFKPDVKREVPRYPYQGEAKLIIVDGEDSSTRRLSVVNISLEGLTAKGNTEIPIGTKAFVEMNPEGTPFVMAGEIVHCTETLGGFKIGIRLNFE
ncbi:MAG: PilZ domain-containing protein [Phycisphaerales bacterium]|nr:PilZ domain-containing protein [Phycisphaerales bacterium]